MLCTCMKTVSVFPTVWPNRRRAKPEANFHCSRHIASFVHLIIKGLTEREFRSITCHFVQPHPKNGGASKHISLEISLLICVCKNGI